MFQNSWNTMLFHCSFTCDLLPQCWSVPIALSVSHAFCYVVGLVFFSFCELSKDLLDFMYGLLSTSVNWEKHLDCRYVFQMSINKCTSKENKFFLDEITVEKKLCENPTHCGEQTGWKVVPFTQHSVLQG